jgi:G3E family GTPase
MRKIRLILVGGFLGAGKTTLLTQAASRLIKQGKKVGIITNDQAAGLVDTEIVKRVSTGVGEVAGGCFCCRFGDLISSLKRLLADFGPDVVLAEPVGSCTDLSATVLQPLKKLYAEMLTVAPYSVLADPTRLGEALKTDSPTLLPRSVHYIFRKQLEEADLIVLNKADLLTKAEVRDLEALVAKCIPARPVLAMSALREKDVDAWLARTLDQTGAGTTITDVDYDTYAEGEAELGWLNATVELRPGRRADLSGFCREFLLRMRDALRARSADIAHLKILLGEGEGSITGNLTGLDAEPSVRGSMESNAGGRLTLLVNARAHIAPEALRATVERCLHQAAGDNITVEIGKLASFRPGRPEPTHRFRHVV